MYIFLTIFILIIIWAIFLLFIFKKKKFKITSEKKENFNKILKRVSAWVNYKEQIIDIDKLCHKILLEWWYEWSFWEILKKEPSEIWDLQKIWELHKIRNKLVHDFDLLSDSILKRRSKEYQNEIIKLLKAF